MREVCSITYHKSLMAMKTPIHGALHIHAWPRLMHHRLVSFNNQAESKDLEIAGMSINISAINTSVMCQCVCPQKTYRLQHEKMHTCRSTYNRALLTQVGKGKHSIRQYWPVRNELLMIDSIVMKGKRIIIPFQLQKQVCSSCTAITWEWKRLNPST